MIETIIGIVVLLLVGWLVYRIGGKVYKRQQGQTFLFSPSHTTSSPEVWTIADTRPFQGNQGTFQSWFYFVDLPTTQQPVQLIEYEGPHIRVSVNIDTQHTAYVVRVIRQTTNQPKEKEVKQVVPLEISTSRHSFPLQRWSLLSVVVYDRRVDVYVDESLVYTYVFTQPIPLEQSATVRLFKERYYGEAKDIRYVSRALPASEIERSYFEGPM
jgi:hypothetical protein